MLEKIQCYVGQTLGKTITDKYTHFDAIEYLEYTVEVADKKIGSLLEGAF